MAKSLKYIRMILFFLGFVATPLCQLNLSQFNHLCIKILNLVNIF